MIDMLEKNEVDIALTVCDALLVARSKGRKIQLSGTWVESPLVWAVAAHPQYATLSVKQLVQKQGKLRVGISRLGSGSHTMANYLAMLHDIDSSLLDFHIANNIQGLREGIKNETFDIFLWETFTTKVYFDSGELVKVLIAFVSFFSLSLCLIEISCCFISWKMFKPLGQHLPLPLKLLQIKKHCNSSTPSNPLFILP